MADCKWGIFHRAEPLHAATLCDLSDSNLNLSPYEGRAAPLNLEGFVIIPNPLYLMNPPTRDLRDFGQWPAMASSSSLAAGFLSCSFPPHVFLCHPVCVCVCVLESKNSAGCRWFHCGCGSIHLLFPESESGAIWPAYGPHAPETGSHC